MLSIITKKDVLKTSFVNGADGGNMLQPLALIIAQEMKNISIEEMRCYV